MTSEWKVSTLGDLIDEGAAELQTGPFGTMLHTSAYRSEGTPVVAVMHIGDNRLIHSELPRVDDETAVRLSRYRLKKGDILFSRKGAVERRAIVREEEGWLQGSDCIRLRVDSNILDSDFLSFAFGTPHFRNWISQNAHGATMPSLNQEILKRISLYIPPIAEQRKIAEQLKAFDDKIELNRKMNATLEQMAQALFKFWFVDFDPVRAKAAGRAPDGMDAETAALFPMEFEDSKLGSIPKGWRISTIGNEVDVFGGSTPSTKEISYWEGGVYSWVTPALPINCLQNPISNLL